ncbi:MAG TPA: rhomboid family intramembrane serine protease [bacterium (Candidatus Stahlbacteria)]|nr:rhomboid family intramembrane serine protease [Candidatus Stahlbacteria bacterium]
MIPLKDDIRSRSLPVLTYSIIGINLLVFLYQFIFTDPHQFIRLYGTIPFEIVHNVDLQPRSPYPVYSNLIFSMFIHGGFLHIVGNMLFLWVFGDNVEDGFGKIRYLSFYLVAGLAGSFLHIIVDPQSRIPAVGASGAISGVLGAYAVLYPRARVLALVPIFFFLRIMYLPAFLFIGIWFFFQLIYAGASGTAGGGVAWFAHIGGFIAGIIFGLAIGRRNQRRQTWQLFS